MIGVNYKSRTLQDLFDYYINQTYKMLGLFENEDVNGYKHSMKIRNQLFELPFQLDWLEDDFRFILVIANIDNITNHLIGLQGEHQDIKNLVMESINLLKDIKGDIE